MSASSRYNIIIYYYNSLIVWLLVCYPQGDSDDQLPRGRLVDELGGGLDVALLAGGEVGGRDGPEVTQLHKK